MSASRILRQSGPEPFQGCRTSDFKGFICTQDFYLAAKCGNGSDLKRLHCTRDFRLAAKCREPSSYSGKFQSRLRKSPIRSTIGTRELNHTFGTNCRKPHCDLMSGTVNIVLFNLYIIVAKILLACDNFFKLCLVCLDFFLSHCIFRTLLKTHPKMKRNNNDFWQHNTQSYVHS